MGLFNSLVDRRKRGIDRVGADRRDVSSIPLGSPWATGELERIIFDDVYGVHQVVGRDQAMSLPPVKRARNLLATMIARVHLVALDAANEPTGAAPWLTATNGPYPPQLRNVWTFDDLYFYGHSCWYRTNGYDRRPTAADRVPWQDWELDDEWHVKIDGVRQRDDQVIVFSGLDEGLLAHANVIEDATKLYRAVRRRLRHPIPGIDLHQTGGPDLTKDQRRELIEIWVAAQDGETGGVGYSSANIEVRELGANADSQLMIEARNAAAVDLARHAGVAAKMVDATAPKASLNYETTQSRNGEFVDFDLETWLLPFEIRLSMDDVVPAGQRVAWDLTAIQSLTLPLTGPARAD